MKSVLDQICAVISRMQEGNDFLHILLGQHKHKVLSGNENIILFGAGAFGAEMCIALRRNGIAPLFFCDNDHQKHGKYYYDLKIIDFDELMHGYKDHLVLITTQRNRIEIVSQLKCAGFPLDRVIGPTDNLNTNLLTMFAMVGTQNVLSTVGHLKDAIFEKLISDKDKIQKVYSLLADKKSKELFISKLALLASNNNFTLFRNFITKFSEPFLEFGTSKINETTEDYFYFNSDIFKLKSNEIYVDVGAFDGDSICSFIDTCKYNNMNYNKIIAFEPDAECYTNLVHNMIDHHSVTCEPMGLWSKSTTLQFISSDQAIHNQAGSISNNGNVKIKVVSLDEYLEGAKITLIKMDPSGNVIPEIIEGARKTIANHTPKLIAGVYHSFDSIYEIPLLINSICPEYQLFLRHNTYHLCDTDLFAIYSDTKNHI